MFQEHMYIYVLNVYAKHSLDETKHYLIMLLLRVTSCSNCLNLHACRGVVGCR